MPDKFQIYEFVATRSLMGERLDRAVSLLTDCSRAQARLAVESGDVAINNNPVSEVAKKITAGDVITINLPLALEARPQADPNVDFEVVYEDVDFAVINKPAGLVVHPGAGNPDKTLVNGLLARYPEIASLEGDELRPGIVHRLDKDTSGLLIVARTQKVQDMLLNAIKTRTVLREYEAICWGELKNLNGIIDAPLGRSKSNKIKMSIRNDGKPARTHYKVLEKLCKATYVQCRLQTGRTHQIRLHFSMIGHPVVGDVLYGEKTKIDCELGRLALHAKRLLFTHPTKDVKMEFEANLPEKLVDIKNQLATTTSK